MCCLRCVLKWEDSEPVFAGTPIISSSSSLIQPILVLKVLSNLPSFVTFPVSNVLNTLQWMDIVIQKPLSLASSAVCYHYSIAGVASGDRDSVV